MEITNVKIFKANQKRPVLAYANIILDNCFIIRGITLLETQKNGRFILMPSRKFNNRTRARRDLCHPLNSDIRAIITDAVFETYDEYIKNEIKE